MRSASVSRVAAGVARRGRAADSGLFEAFHTTKPHGLGMGLAINRSIVEAHGGRLGARANPPHGTVFQFTLPTDGEKGS